FDNDLQRLGEIMGALHYLRAICGANEGQKWRNEMQALLDAEAPSGERRRKIVASFNRGYRGFQQSYRSCTPAADLAIRRYLDEGAKIARDITARYAN
ncbi:MAG: TIGR02301 family protein, partial [Pseudolabrys sp.]